MMPVFTTADQLTTCDPATPRSSQAGLTTPLSLRERMALRLQRFKAQVKEYLLFDSRVFRFMAGWIGLCASWIFWITGRKVKSFRILCQLHRGDFCGAANRRAEHLVRDASAAAGAGVDYPIVKLYRSHFEDLRPIPQTEKFLADPAKLLGSIAMVLKSPTATEKGVLILQYSYTFPLFAKLFDVPRIAERYYIVLEPTWSGYCDPDILAYSRYRIPVIVQGLEPRDGQFLERTCPNLHWAPLGNSSWLDHRLFAPDPRVEKDFDIVMNAGWADYKRHRAFFLALRTLKRSGRSLRVLLIGYSIDQPREHILRLAQHLDVSDLIHTVELIPYEEVSSQLNRAKVGVLWSRKEGSNRAIVEMMLTGLPCVLRKGHNYGHHYAHINDQTGCFSTEKDLPDTLFDMVNHYRRFSPREWVLENMSCQRSALILSDAIGTLAAAVGDRWSGGLAVKVNHLHSMSYWDSTSTDRFRPDYTYILTERRLLSH